MGETEETEGTRSGIRRIVLGLLVLAVVGGLAVAGVVVRRELFEVEIAEGPAPVDTPSPILPRAEQQTDDPSAPLTPAEQRPGLVYVALGDSFSAGPGLAPQVDRACVRSSRNYASYLASWLRVGTVRDVTCSGATIANLEAVQERPSAAVPPQVGALTKRTDLVTLSLGGNDYNLFQTLFVTTCQQAAASDPTGSPCKDELDDDIDERLPAIAARVRDAIRLVRDRAPQAELVVIGYPQIMPRSGTCSALPFATGDYAWLGDVAETLDNFMARTAAEEGVRYVDLLAATAGHDACSDDPWVNGAGYVSGGPWQYHPTAQGMLGVARAIYSQLTGRAAPR